MRCHVVEISNLTFNWKVPLKIRSIIKIQIYHWISFSNNNCLHKNFIFGWYYENNYWNYESRRISLALKRLLWRENFCKSGIIFIWKGNVLNLLWQISTQFLTFFPKTFNKRLLETCSSVWASEFSDNCAIPIFVRKPFKWVIAYGNEKWRFRWRVWLLKSLFGWWQTRIFVDFESEIKTCQGN